ncbi:MAG: hypothetical protein ACOC56_04905 [Atribacterota bacterium]
MDKDRNWTGNKKSIYVTMGASNHTKKIEYLMIITLLIQKQ